MRTPNSLALAYHVVVTQVGRRGNAFFSGKAALRERPNMMGSCDPGPYAAARSNTLVRAASAAEAFSGIPVVPSRAWGGL